MGKHGAGGIPITGRLGNNNEATILLSHFSRRRVQADGFIPPWKRMFGETWTPEPETATASDKPSFLAPVATKTANWPDVAGHEVAELPGEEYFPVVGKGIFHTLPPRHNGIDPEISLGARPPPFKTNPSDARAGAFGPGALPEGEEVYGVMPEEPVSTGWSSLSYIQPAGYASSELTIFSRGAYGALLSKKIPPPPNSSTRSQPPRASASAPTLDQARPCLNCRNSPPHPPARSLTHPYAPSLAQARTCFILP